MPPAPTATPPVLTLSVALPGDDGEAAAPCHELAVAAQQAAAGDGLLISRLQLLGSEAAMAGAEGAGGLALFSGGEGGSHPSARQAQAPPSKQALPVAEVLLRVGLGSAPELEPVALPLRVRAGAPRALRLLPGHPWDAPSAGGGAVSLAHGAALPPFQVAAYDAWGNPTAPSPDLGFAVLAECGALGPHALECAVGPLGVATVEGAAGGAGLEAREFARAGGVPTAAAAGGQVLGPSPHAQLTRSSPCCRSPAPQASPAPALHATAAPPC